MQIISFNNLIIQHKFWNFYIDSHTGMLNDNIEEIFK